VHVTVIVMGSSSCMLRSLFWKSNTSLSVPGATLIARPLVATGIAGEKSPALA
jgi:hypothetical protein